MIEHQDQHFSRRKLLGLLGIGAAGLAGCTDAVEEIKPGDNGEKDHDSEDHGEVTEPITERYPEATSTVQQDFARVVDEEYPESSDYFRSFLSDAELEEDFKDEQLSILLEKAPERWRKSILVTEALDQDDWTRNGRNHINPEGNPGPDYENPFTLSTAPDSFLEGYFNSTGHVYDPRTGEYLGFQPEETYGVHEPSGLKHYGDKVGLKGDRNGNGSIAEFLEGVEREDLNPDQMHTMMAYNWMDYKPEEEAFEEMNEIMEEKVPEDVFRDVMENTPNRSNLEEVPAKVNMYTIDLGQVPYDFRTDGEEAHEIYDRNMPEELRGPVPHTLYVNDLPSNAGGLPTGTYIPPDSQVSPIGHAASAIPHTGSNEEAHHHNARLTFQELYWHRVGTHPNHDIKFVEDRELDPPQVEPPNGTPTLTTDSLEKLDFLPSEWRHVIRGMNTRFRPFYQTPFHKNRIHNPVNDEDLFDNDK
jgi:hypothetical protein